MAHGVLPFQFEVEKKDVGMTALVGLALYLEFCQVIGLGRMIDGHIQARTGTRGPADDQMIKTMVLFDPAKGNCVESLRVFEGNEGFCRVLKEVKEQGGTRSEPRALKRMWRKERTRTFLSPTGTREYLERFHDVEQ